MARIAVACVLAAMITPFAAQAAAPDTPPTQVPDFNGMWAKDNYNYPKPYMTRRAITGGMTGNPYLKPWVVDALMKDDAVAESGHALPTSHSLCYPEGVPYVLGEIQVQVLQTPKEITLLYGGEQEQVRTIYMNRPHSAHVTPSWFGESVGHFEGDTLIVDTIGVGVHPEAGSMGFFGTPHTDKLHIVEEYRYLRPGEKTIAPPLRDNNGRNPPYDRNDIVKDGKTLRLTFTVDDPGAYKKPWTVTMDLMQLKSHTQEYVCAENYQDVDLIPLVPRAAVPDF